MNDILDDAFRKKQKLKIDYAACEFELATIEYKIAVLNYEISDIIRKRSEAKKHERKIEDDDT